MQELRLELLLSRPVKDPSGKVVGHIEEIRVRKSGDEWVISEYLIGPAAFAERFAIKKYPNVLMPRLDTRRGAAPGYRIPWNKLDLSDPENPKLMGAVDEVCESMDGPFEDRNWFEQGGVSVT